jgi:hypothetical protein
MTQADSLSEAEAAATAAALLTNFIRFTWLTGLSLVGAKKRPSVLNYLMVTNICQDRLGTIKQKGTLQRKETKRFS